jgi:hypothetical protein
MAPQGQPAGFRPTPQQLAQLAASGQAGGRVASALAPFAEKPQPVPEKLRLMRQFGFPETQEGYRQFEEFSRAPQDTRTSDEKNYETALKGGFKGSFYEYLTGLRKAGSQVNTIQMPVPVYDSKTGQTTYVTREEAIGKTPASAAPKPKESTVTEQQAATVTGRLVRRVKEISDALKRSPQAEAPTATEAALQNIPGLSAATNLVRSTDRQIVATAQDDILDALLYLATGAAYNKEQLQQQKSAYLSSWSDDPPTRAIKRQRLTDMVRDAKIRAGDAWTSELDSQLNLLLESPAIQKQSEAPIYARNPKTGERIMSVDGGNTWTPAR